MATLLDSYEGKVKGGGYQWDNNATGNTPPVGNTGSPYLLFEPAEIYDIHQRFLQTFVARYRGKPEHGVDDKAVEDCLERCSKNGYWGSGNVDITVDILGIASEDYIDNPQTILHMILPALRPTARDARDLGYIAVARGVIGLFRWLMKRFPDLYSLKGDDSGSYHDFLQVAIHYVLRNLRPSPAQKRNIIMERHTEAVCGLLKVFVYDFPEQAAELLKTGPAPIDGGHAHRVHDLLSLVEGIEGIGGIEPLFKALDAATILATDGARGNTVLHRATSYGTSPGWSAEKDWALRIVKILVEKCPEALQVLNSDTLSPYQTRVRNCKAERSIEGGGVKLFGDDDEVALFLEDQYRRYPVYVATYLLYGVRGTELYLNLMHLKDKSVPEKQLVLMLERLNLDTYLKSVRLPQFEVVPDENQRANNSNAQEQYLGSGRADFGIVFRVLREIGVRKIMRIEVEDLDKLESHSDDIIIDSLKDFNIEEWDWRKLDLCTEVIAQAAQDVRQIRLYSSGNNAVLRGWSGKGGLRSFRWLQNVHVTFKQGLVSKGTLEKYGENFKKRIGSRNFKLVLKFPEWGSSPVSPLGGTSAGGGGDEPDDRISENPWIRDMGRFSSFVCRALPKKPSGEAVKVAIIDDGIDLFNFDPRNKEVDLRGCSFDPDHEGNPWYIPNGKHGTLMAKLVRLICPGSSLYIARLGSTLSHPSAGSSQLQPTATSAIEAICWAVEKDVDIISMSWAIAPPGGEEAQKFGDAINAARSKNILLFGTTYKDNTYPVDSHDGIICIGGADIHGGLIPESRKGNPMFTFPSSGLGHEFQQDGDAAGSSISTALAAGLAALILYCAGYTGLDGSRQVLKRGMVKAFSEMVEKPRYVNPKLFFGLNNFDPRHGEGVEPIRRAIKELTKATKPL